MKAKHILYFFLATILLSCSDRKNNASTDKEIALNNKPENKKDYSERAKISYIIFGVFCGECGGECATMFKMDYQKNRLLVDHTDSYFKREIYSPIVFADEITDEKKINYAKEIKDSIPNILLSATQPQQKFGCPDCLDGCGIHFEIKQDTTIKQFAFDYQTSQLTGDIKLFAEYLIKQIKQIDEGRDRKH